ncbi:MAG: hypothetical protein G01um101438_616 [Parcubacteria group bacterium Gr01-1014_38]|nr:MAG: hypothetical protein G01um101438_616 [Parcubacteria group bacterium Gr01-1014_38]
MAIKLQHLLQTPSRDTEPHDVYAAFTRLARVRWGQRAPLEPQQFTRGVLTVSCPSPLWRAEILSLGEELRSALQEALPTLSLRRIRAILL